MTHDGVLVPKSWRSEIHALFAFFVLGIVSTLLSRYYPGSVINGELFTLFGITVHVALPLFWLVPMFSLLFTITRIYDVRYIIDSRGLESKVGILGLNQRITRVRFEDIRSIEIEQTVMDRILDIGDVEIGTAAVEGIEMVLCGIAAPREVQDMIQSERDKRDRLAKKSFTKPEQRAVV